MQRRQPFKELVVRSSQLGLRPTRVSRAMTGRPAELRVGGQSV